MLICFFNIKFTFYGNFNNASEHEPIKNNMKLEIDICLINLKIIEKNYLPTVN
jgi:hypothetical protein